MPTGLAKGVKASHPLFVGKENKRDKEWGNCKIMKQMQFNLQVTVKSDFH